MYIASSHRKSQRSQRITRRDKPATVTAATANPRIRHTHTYAARAHTHTYVHTYIHTHARTQHTRCAKDQRNARTLHTASYCPPVATMTITMGGKEGINLTSRKEEEKTKQHVIIRTF